MYSWLKQIGAFVFVTGILTSPWAWGQTPPTGPTIENRSVKRNPFVPPSNGSPFVLPTPAAPGPAGAGVTVHPPLKQEPVPPPTFTVVGIYSSAGTTGALVNGGQLRTVVVGDTIGAYRVTAIDVPSRSVVVAAKNQSFRLGLPATRK
jgi:hypothetical protein